MFSDSIPEEGKVLLELLEKRGYEAYLVGGCVRDLLRGEAPHDWDMTTSATPEQMKNCFEGYRTIETGIRHGTLSVLSGGRSFEVTTFRVDGKYEDNRRPREVFFTRRLEDDLSRRDFTVNAMAYSPSRGLTDLYGGREDIEGGVIRCVGQPDLRFAEDGLRILRALRFASVLDFEIEGATADSIRKNRTLLVNISAERIRDEFFKLVCGKGAERILLGYPEVICEFIPEMREAVGFDQRNRAHAYDVYTHTVKSVASAAPDLIVRLALFFHDIGKPAAFTEDEKGGHFYGHQEISAALAGLILRRLRADNATVSAVRTLVAAHHKIISNTEKGVRRILASLGELNTRRLLELRRGDNSALVPELKEERLAEISESERLLDEILAKDCCLSLRRLAIGGDDLLAAGMSRGREVGKLLAALLDAVIDGGLPNEREALLTEAQRRIEAAQNPPPSSQKNKNPDMG